MPCKYQKNSGRNNFILARLYTARKTIFFLRRPEKMVFPKKSRWNLTFLLLSGNMIISPKIWSYHQAENERWSFSKKKYTEIWYFLQKKDGLFKKGHDLSWTIKKGCIFSQKHGNFSLDGKREKDELSQEILGNMIFCIWYVPRPQELYMEVCLSANRGNYLSIRRWVIFPKI